MARRRQPDAPVVAESTLPPELAMGPCIETWAPDIADPVKAWWAARRNWLDAGREWAVEVGGLDQWGNPVSNFQNEIGQRRPWSRRWLLEQGQQDVVDYFEGRRPEPPDSFPPWGPFSPPEGSS
jgi:hypothetical protein